MTNDDLIAVKAMLEKFIKEHFYVSEGLLIGRRDEYLRGNFRYGFANYLVGNIEVAVLVGNNSRWEKQNEKVQKLVSANSNAMYIELLTSAFFISTILVLRTIYDYGDKLIEFHDFEFSGNTKSAKAYFTFAKLTK